MLSHAGQGRRRRRSRRCGSVRPRWEPPPGSSPRRVSPADATTPLAPPSACTRYSPVSWSRINCPRRNPLPAATGEIGSSVRAVTTRRIGCRRPASTAATAGRSPRTPPARTTGLAGSRNVGTFRGRADRTLGRTGLHGDPGQVQLAEFGQHRSRRPQRPHRRPHRRSPPPRRDEQTLDEVAQFLRVAGAMPTRFTSAPASRAAAASANELTS